MPQKAQPQKTRLRRSLRKLFKSNKDSFDCSSLWFYSNPFFRYFIYDSWTLRMIKSYQKWRKSKEKQSSFLKPYGLIKRCLITVDREIGEFCKEVDVLLTGQPVKSSEQNLCCEEAEQLDNVEDRIGAEFKPLTPVGEVKLMRSTGKVDQAAPILNAQVEQQEDVKKAQSARTTGVEELTDTNGLRAVSTQVKRLKTSSGQRLNKKFSKKKKCKKFSRKELKKSKPYQELNFIEEKKTILTSTIQASCKKEYYSPPQNVKSNTTVIAKNIASDFISNVKKFKTNDDLSWVKRKQEVKLENDILTLPTQHSPEETIFEFNLNKLQVKLITLLNKGSFLVVVACFLLIVYWSMLWE